MRRIDLIIFTTLIYGLVFTLTGCEKNTPKEEPDYYLGKWRLMSVSFAWTRYSEFPTPPIFDLSERDVAYNFNKNGLMYILGEMAEFDLDSDTEQGCWDLYLRYGIGTGEYEYTTKFVSESVDWGWYDWSFKIGDKDYGLTVWEANTSPEFSKTKHMRIIKAFPYNELPLVNMRTAKSDDAPPSAWFEVHLEKVEESL